MYSERRNTSTGASLRRLDKMASCIQAARPLHDRRLHAGGMPSYAHAPGRWPVRSLRICKETGHEGIEPCVRGAGRSQGQRRPRGCRCRPQWRVRHVGTIGGDVVALGKALRKITSKGHRLHVVCEAGPCGFATWRHLATKGIACDVVAPSPIPKRAGDRVKTTSARRAWVPACAPRRARAAARPGRRGGGR